MTGDTAIIQVALTECLLPSELGQLVEMAARDKRTPGEVITLAVRDYLERRSQVQPEASVVLTAVTP